eukprot:TRINITY_DN36636_c0_g1_i1.p1 TRINITY_DN36636_c0_g1~~TRINITY_DN36636_c0_g1_i1.p1  ORF type:complete len:142 (+),score=34.90 TRINITY_DN36636_c0_g1_i1:124-549(+)
MSLLCACCGEGNGPVVEAADGSSSGVVPVPESVKSAEAEGAPAANEFPPDAREFQVVVTKVNPADRIGLDISAVGGKVLKVWKIKEGLVNDWNSGKGEEDQVKAGDAIVSVNGNRGSSDVLLDEVAKAPTLDMVFARGMFA